MRNPLPEGDVQQARYEIAAGMVPAARVSGLVKRFGPKTVLSDIDLTIEPRQIHALLGANGAGKSSIVKVLAGYYSCDQGTIEVGGTPAPPLAGVVEMAALGVRVVHQDLGLVDGLSILENVAIGSRYVLRRLGLVNWPATAERVRVALKMVGLDLPLDSDVAQLSTWQRVAIACARALCDGLDVVRLLILDEVTAALPRAEVVRILAIVRRLRDMGAGILYVTHRFEEVVEIADWVTVLRNGTVFESRTARGMTAVGLVESVVGHQVDRAKRNTPDQKSGESVLRVHSLRTRALRDVSLEVKGGEICGVIGRAGCGRSALGRVIFGDEQPLSGSITVAGERFDRRRPSLAMRRGISYVPQDRQRAGIFPSASIRENLSVVSMDEISRLGFVSASADRRFAARLIDLYGIVPADPEEDIRNLSGGNQQKIVVGRWADDDVRLFILDEPTEGVDAAARASIYEFIRARAARGAAVLLLSSSIEEIAEVCDRAIILKDGKVGEELSGEKLAVREIEKCLIAEA